MQAKISDVAIKPIKVKPEEKNFSRGERQSWEILVSNSSSEVYYRDASVAIPFRWESHPGTPKVRFPEREGDRPLPPLTPPPSYLSSPAKRSVKKHSSKSTTIFRTVLPRLNLRKNQLQSSPTSSFSSSSSLSPWSSSCSVPSSPLTSKSRAKERYSIARLSFELRADEDDDYKSPVSTLCFGTTARSSNVRSRGCSANVIKLLLGELS